MPYKKKTKIICTIGPATESEVTLEALLKSGMNVMRLNFSHGDFAEHQVRVDRLRKILKKYGRAAAILQDLGGPKIRIGTFKTDFVVLKEGQKFTLTTEKVEGDIHKVYVNYSKLPKEVKKGDTIFLHDGRKKLQVISVRGNEVVTKVLIGGEIKGKRGVNLPDSELSISSLTEKDIADLEFGIKNNVDYIALSFVRRPEDILELRAILDKRKSKAGIIAKIETPQAVKNIDEIINIADGIMVARGDLAIEIPAEDVPLIQKMIINKCNEAAKPVITATQMLESMIKSPIPTRAEVSDVANAILDGTDAVMLSEETTLGDFPLHAVEVMTRVAIKTENDLLHRQLLERERGYKTVGESVAASVVRTADRIEAKYIISLTNGGYSDRMTSRHRSNNRIIVATPNPLTFTKSTLYFACTPLLIKSFKSFDETVAHVKELLVKIKMAEKGDKVVIISSVPFGKVQQANLMMVETI
jgi:pyruvate kinase